MTTREKIIQQLSKHQALSAASLSRILGLTKANIHYHLNILIEENKIARQLDNISLNRKGRPTYHYVLTNALSSNNLETLACNLLHLYLSSQPNKNEAIASLAKLMAPVKSETNILFSRLNHTIESINQYNYQARWEARKKGPCIIFLNCPYASILHQHEELCLMDKEILKLLLDLPVQTIQTKYNNGINECIFYIQTE